MDKVAKCDSIDERKDGTLVDPMKRIANAQLGNGARIARRDPDEKVESASLIALLAQFLGFAGVGVIATLLQYVVLVLLVQIAGVNTTLSSAVGYVAGALTSYALNYRYTFRSNRKHMESVIKFALVACVGLALNTGVMLVLTRGVRMHYLLAQLLATGIVLLWNFVANRSWTFAR